LKISDAKIIKKILRSLPKRFRIKVTTIEENNDLDNMRIKELFGSLQTYEFSLPPLRKTKSIALKIPGKKKSKKSSDEDSDEKDGLAIFTRNFRKLMNSSNRKFRNKNAKFFENSKGDSKGIDQDKFEYDEKDPRVPRCFECSSYGHIGNLNSPKVRLLMLL
jgi:hypothetical protein